MGWRSENPGVNFGNSTLFIRRIFVLDDCFYAARVVACNTSELRGIGKFGGDNTQVPRLSGRNAFGQSGMSDQWNITIEH